MKIFTRYLLLGFLLPLLTSCPHPDEPMPYSAYEPVLMSRTQLETSVVKKPATPLRKPGKIYRYGSLILINEQYKGVHLINNQDPAHPVNIGFIQVPGNIDFAVKENVLYVDNAVDMVAISLQDINNIQVKKRIRNAFPALVPPDSFRGFYYLGDVPDNTVVVGWEPKKGTE